MPTNTYEIAKTYFRKLIRASRNKSRPHEDKARTLKDPYALYVVNLEDLTKAVRAAVPEERLTIPAESIALCVLDRFAYNDSTLDNQLESKERRNFLILKDAGLLITSSYVTTPFRRGQWTIHEWWWNKEQIYKLAHGERKTEPRAAAVINPTKPDVYAGLSDDVWSNHAAKR